VKDESRIESRATSVQGHSTTPALKRFNHLNPYTLLPHLSLLAGIDLGSTSLKVVVYDLEGRAVAHASRPTELAHPDPNHPDWAIWQPEQIWGGIAESLCEVTARLPDPRAIKAVAVTGMGMDGVPVDKSGNWLYPFISWHCPRTAPQQQWWLQHIGAEKQFSIGGNPVWGFNTALRLL